VADTFAGRIHVERDGSAPVTPLGQLPIIEYLKQGSPFDGWVARCPMHFTSPNAPSKRDVLGTVLLSVLAGHRRYAHITTSRCDFAAGHEKSRERGCGPPGLRQDEEEAGLSWQQLLWILDADTTVKPLYDYQEGAVVSYNPHTSRGAANCDSAAATAGINASRSG
jgi:hypothetical protein